MPETLNPTLLAMCIRSGRSFTGATLGDLKAGQKLLILGREPPWLRVQDLGSSDGLRQRVSGSRFRV